MRSLSVNEQGCVFVSEKHLSQTCVRKSSALVNVRIQLKGKNREGNRDLRSHPPVFLRDAPVVLLPPLVVITGGIGLFHTARTSSGLTVWCAVYFSCGETFRREDHNSLHLSAFEPQETRNRSYFVFNFLPKIPQVCPDPANQFGVLCLTVLRNILLI